jgi:CBS domain-containing protein
MKVSSILRSKGTHVETVRPDATVLSVSWDLKLKRIGALVVSEDGATVQGLISERDIVAGLTEHGPQLLSMPVRQVMAPATVTCTPDDTLATVMARMTRHRARHVPVVDAGRLAGIVSIGDIVKHRLDELELEANVLRDTLITR